MPPLKKPLRVVRQAGLRTAARAARGAFFSKNPSAGPAKNGVVQLNQVGSGRRGHCASPSRFAIHDNRTLGGVCLLGAPRGACCFTQPKTTLNNGYLGSRNDEERSEMRYVV